ncbi:MAG: DNA repair protein RadA [Fusobacteria bacterium]|nr:MAG: DNA repair protein RadA [Fusobacteriota bacterium]KAF0227929.1 MAG: DNA repair protein [Fusobacteriota bacterium]
MKNKTHFVCNECGNQSGKWLGKCPVCSSWNSYIEEMNHDVADDKKKHSIKAKEYPKATLLEDVLIEDFRRVKTSNQEVDRVLGGGLVIGSLTLIAGDPGIGKSTLLMQLASSLGSENKVLYVSGEESARQIKMRVERLGLPKENIYILAENNMDDICATINDIDPLYIIIDSIQTVYQNEMTGTPGSVGQVREATLTLMKIAKGQGRSVLIVGHVTKSGNIAGPKVLEHMVDTVLYLEGEKDHSYRILRSAKNRFGSTQEIGVFEMGEEGLVEVINPSKYFLTHMSEVVPGSIIVPVIEGTRTLLLEIQSLTVDSSFPVPRRLSTGIDLNRIILLIAVLEKNMKLSMGKKDIYFNIVGGLKIEDRGLDLGVVIALISSLYNIPINKNVLVVGEIGLTGEIRTVSGLEQRIKESEKLGFEKIIVPKTKGLKKANKNIEIIEVSNIKEAVNIFLSYNKGGNNEKQ